MPSLFYNCRTPRLILFEVCELSFEFRHLFSLGRLFFCSCFVRFFTLLLTFHLHFLVGIIVGLFVIGLATVPLMVRVVELHREAKF